MAKTFFIDSDEEIISVIGHLRTSPDAENYFVFPKRSLVLQSAVNLRLFHREAEKQGKRITIISQDENGRKLAERVGLATKEYAPEIGSLRQEAPSSSQSGSAPASVSRDRSQMDTATPTPPMPSSSKIGSNTFVAQKAVSGTALASSQQEISTRTKPAESPESEHRLKIRDMSPSYQTSLNSLRDSRQTPPVPLRQGIPLKPEQERVTPSLSSGETFHPGVAPLKQTSEAAMSPNGQDPRLQRFFGQNTAVSETRSSRPTLPDVSPSSSSNSVAPPATTHKSFWKMFAWILGTIGVLAGTGAAIYFFIPKAEVILTPHEITHDTEMRLKGKTLVPMSEERDTPVPVRKLEKNFTSTVTLDATGKMTSGNQKARGTIVISNEYSSDSQPLIATTRFESPDGKIFRLAESVTVPGMTLTGGKREAGVVEVVVVADAPGEEYNIAPTKFVIPGLRGGPKYAKFHGESVKTFTGGGDGGDSMTSITKEDTERAIQKLKDQSHQDFLQAMQQELLSDELIMEESIEIIDTKKSALPLIGSLGESFETTGDFVGRAFVISERILKDNLANQNLPNRQGVTFRVTDAKLSFNGITPHYDENMVDFNVHAILTLTSSIETEAIRDELLGQNESGIKAVLETHPEIKKIEVNFSPEFLFQSIPSSAKRVSVRVISEP